MQSNEGGMSRLVIGDIVLIEKADSYGESQRELGVVVLADSEEVSFVRMTAPTVETDDAAFTPVIVQADLEDGELDQSYQIFLKKINTIGKVACQKIAALKKEKIDAILRSLSKIFPEQYYHLFHTPVRFVPEESRIPYAGRVFDQEEVLNLIDCSLDFWLTEGRFVEQFEKELARYIGVRYALLVNSGSSANLLAFAALTSKTLDNPLEPGDEVITLGSGFPTTVNPIIQYGCVPVFVDVDRETANVDGGQLEEALSEKTRAVMIAHTLGNPFDVDRVLGFCKENSLFLIEDNCDALGSRYKGKLTGSFGDIATQSFYPPHHMTTGEGGAVLTNSPRLHKIILSFRDWGRDCWCLPGKENTCGKRFNGQYGTLPYGYDHKYVFSHIGYNLKPLDFQGALGLAQLKKVPGFIRARRENHARIGRAVRDISWLWMQKPTPHSEPSWFGALLGVLEGAPLNRNQLVEFFEEKGIATRQLFGGNLIHQPAYLSISKRIIGTLEDSSWFMDNAFFIGVYPGYTEDHLKYIEKTIFDLKKL